MAGDRRRPLMLLVGLCLSALLLAVLAPGAEATRKKAPTRTETASFKARGSIGQIYVIDARPGSKLLLANPRGRIARKGKADRFGSKIFRYLRPGKGYRVLQPSGKRIPGTKRIRVLKAGANPRQSYYEQQPVLQEGLNYIKMRDGIELAVALRLPPGKTLADGPFPTVIEHSGYQTAAPHDLFAAIASGKDDPLAPATSTIVGSLLGPRLGFAVVSVQMRGSGCSGGAYDLFGLPTTYDGYDMIETVAHQPWVDGNVGMIGISYSGITQLFAAGTQPPHLAAIAPMSVTDDIYTATGYPGGIFNSGFALSWITERVDDAMPAPEGGQPYAKALVEAGDRHCIRNQNLRLQSLDALGLVETNPYRKPKLFDERAPGDWLKKVDVPVFLTGQYQDEQTGGHFPESLNNLDRNRNVWVTMQNGVHTDSLGPMAMTRWVEFLDLFVADRVPEVPGVLTGPGNLYGAIAGPSAPVEQSRYVGMADVNAARAAFKNDNPRYRLLMDNGAGPWGLGAQGATWEMKSSSWPPNRAEARRYFLGANGRLGGAKQSKRSKAGYLADPGARPLTNLASGGVNATQPDYDWAPVAGGRGLGFTGGTLSKDVVISGPSSLDLYLRSSKRDTDLQATISEVRPDGNETYVQSGWLRASHRKLDRDRSTALDPVPTHLKRDAEPLPKKGFTKVRVPIYPVSHAFRAGSKIRVTILATGGDRSEWEFDTIDSGKTKNVISLGGRMASKLVLPVLGGATAKGTPLPEPTALRAQPNRTYQEASNGG